MNTTRYVTHGLAVAALLAVVAPARAQDDRLDPYSFQTWGGTYMSDCGNNASAKVTVFEADLVFLQGNKRVAGAKLRAAPSFLGPEPPENYVTTLLSEQPGELQFIAYVYKDEQGEYITLDGDLKVVAQIGKPALALKYRRCDAAAKRTASAVTPTPAPGAAKAAPAVEQTSAPDMLGNAGFKAAYYKALGRLAREPWLAELDGPSQLNRKVTVAGKQYVLVSACKNHDCYDNSTVLLYSAPRKLVYGWVHLAGKPVMIGNPPPAVAKKLGALWRADYRSNP